MAKEEKSEYDEKAEAFMKKYGWSMKTTKIGPEFDRDFDQKKPHMTYRVAIRKKCSDGRTRGFTVRFHASLAHPDRCTPYDVLGCLQKRDPETLDDFCAEYGYEVKGLESYRRLRRIYSACVREWKNVNRLCETERELEELSEIW